MNTRIHLSKADVTDVEERLVASADFSMMIVALRKTLRPMASAKDTDPDL